jgi:hypothetical protein
MYVPDNTRFNYLELFNNFVKLLLRSVYREHEHGIQSEVKLKETISSWDYKIKLRTIRRKYKTHGRTKIIVWTMCFQFTSYQFEETLRAFIKTNLDFADQENVVVRDSILKIDLKINSGNWSLVVIQKILSFENELVRKVIVTISGKDSTRQITRHASLDYNINENEMLTMMLLWFLSFMYLLEYLWIFVKC